MRKLLFTILATLTLASAACTERPTPSSAHDKQQSASNDEPPPPDRRN